MPRVQSSAIDRVDYTPETMTLDIWYKDAGLYSYSGVPEHVYRALLAAPSVGCFVNETVKDHYPFAAASPRRRFRPE